MSDVDENELAPVSERGNRIFEETPRGVLTRYGGLIVIIVFIVVNLVRRKK